MKIIDKGVLSQSVIDFTIPSSFARETLYYPIEYGDFSVIGIMLSNGSILIGI